MYRVFFSYQRLYPVKLGYGAIQVLCNTIGGAKFPERYEGVRFFISVTWGRGVKFPGKICYVT